MQMQANTIIAIAIYTNLSLPPFKYLLWGSHPFPFSNIDSTTTIWAFIIHLISLISILNSDSEFVFDEPWASQRSSAVHQYKLKKCYWAASSYIYSDSLDFNCKIYFLHQEAISNLLFFIFSFITIFTFNFKNPIWINVLVWKRFFLQCSL